MDYPTPVKRESRICFGISFFATEADADAAAAIVRKRGDTYNGGWYDGMPCGRDTAFDHVDRDTGQQVYAVTTR